MWCCWPSCRRRNGEAACWVYEGCTKPCFPRTAGSGVKCHWLFYGSTSGCWGQLALRKSCRELGLVLLAAFMLQLCNAACNQDMACKSLTGISSLVCPFFFLPFFLVLSDALIPVGAGGAQHNECLNAREETMKSDIYFMLLREG